MNGDYSSDEEIEEDIVEESGSHETEEEEITIDNLPTKLTGLNEVR